MTSSTFKLLTVRGISIGAHWSWLLVFLLVTWSLSSYLFPRDYPNLGDTSYLVMGIAAAVIFFGSILLHELGHAFRALKEGMKVGDITLWLFGGVARFEGMFPSAGAEFRIAIAGPVVSLLLAIGFGVVAAVSGAAGMPAEVTGVAAYLANINAIVLAFNLVPALPLDGGRVLRSWLWHRQRSFSAATISAAKAGKAFAHVLMGIGILSFFTQAFTGGLWFVFLGFFLLQAAEAEAQFVLVRQAFSRYRVQDLMTGDPVVVPAGLTVAEFLERTLQGRGYSTYPVSDGSELQGLISVRGAGAVGGSDRSSVRVGDVMVPADSVPVLDPETPMMEALVALRAGIGRAVVVKDGSIVGILSISDVAKALELEQARGIAPEPGARKAGPVVWVVVSLLILLAASAFVRPPVAVVAPATAIDVSGDVTISGVDTAEITGQYLLLGVSVGQPSALGVLYAIVHPSREIVPMSAVLPEDVSDREFIERQEGLFRESQMLAAAAAAEAAGMDVTREGSGALVAGVMPGTPAAEVLDEGDVITAIDGNPVHLATDLRNAVAGRPPQTRFALTVERGDETVQVEISSARLDAQRGAPPALGVLIETLDLDIQLPFEIDFRERAVGGPSAGLLYALVIADMLDPEDLAAGRTIGASGTINNEGRVGPVGSLNQKAEAAGAEGAEILLVPQQEVGFVQDARGMTVRGVESLQDALATLGGT